MSKIGQKPVVLGAAQAEYKDKSVTIKGTKGALSYVIPSELEMEMKDGSLILTTTGNTKQHRSVHGLIRNILANAVFGVTQGWSKRLEIVGTGFNVKTQGQTIVLKIGFSHTVTFGPIEGIQLSSEGTTIIIVSGADKELVGQVSQQIISVRKPDIYKGKGIKHEGTRMKLKPGKKAKTA